MRVVPQAQPLITLGALPLFLVVKHAMTEEVILRRQRNARRIRTGTGLEIYIIYERAAHTSPQTIP